MISVLKALTASILLFLAMLAAYRILMQIVTYLMPKNSDFALKNKVVLSSLYFINLLFGYNYQPELFLKNGQVAGHTYLWAWATLVVVLFLAPQLRELF